MLHGPSIKISTGSFAHEINKIETTVVFGPDGQTRDTRTYDYSYEEVKNKILAYIISDQNAIHEKIKHEFPELLEKNKEDDKLIQEKIAFYHKKYGVDEAKFREILRENDALKNENNSLKSKNKHLSSEKARFFCIDT